MIPIPAPQIPNVAAVVKRHLRTIPWLDMPAELVIEFLIDRTFQLWMLPGAILITEIVQHPTSTVLVLRYGAGKLPKNPKEVLSQVVIPWAKSYGCTRIEVVGRPGWQRVLGLTERHVIMRGQI